MTSIGGPFYQYPMFNPIVSKNSREYFSMLKYVRPLTTIKNKVHKKKSVFEEKYT